MQGEYTVMQETCGGAMLSASTHLYYSMHWSTYSLALLGPNAAAPETGSSKKVPWSQTLCPSYWEHTRSVLCNLPR